MSWKDISKLLKTDLMIFFSPNWVLDSSAYLCTLVQSLRKCRGLRKGKVILWVSNRASVALWSRALNLRDYHLDLVLRYSLYHLHGDTSVNLFEQTMSTIGSERFRVEINLKYLWYFRLAHIREKMIYRLEKYGLLGSLTVESYLVCKLSLWEKMIKLPFVRQREGTTDILALIHIWYVWSIWWSIQGRLSLLYYLYW